MDALHIEVFDFEVFLAGERLGRANPIQPVQVMRGHGDAVISLAVQNQHRLLFFGVDQAVKKNRFQARDSLYVKRGIVSERTIDGQLQIFVDLTRVC